MTNKLYTLFHYYFEQGGVINILIFVVCFVTLYLGIGKLLDFFILRKRMPSIEDLSKIHMKGVLAPKLPRSFYESFSDIHADKEEQRSPGFFINRYREVLVNEVNKLENGLSTMAAWISVAPLLGLLGTVAGMMKTFSVITTYGIGNPTLLSEGISVSLITTQTGLLVAFPGLLFHTYLSGKKDKLVHQLLYNGEAAITHEGVKHVV